MNSKKVNIEVRIGQSASPDANAQDLNPDKARNNGYYNDFLDQIAKTSSRGSKMKNKRAIVEEAALRGTLKDGTLKRPNVDLPLNEDKNDDGDDLARLRSSSLSTSNHSNKNKA